MPKTMAMAMVFVRTLSQLPLSNPTKEDCAMAVLEAGGVNALIQCLGKPTDDVLQEKSVGCGFDQGHDPKGLDWVRRTLGS